MTPTQILLLRIALVALALVCFVFGAFTARKGLQVARTREIDGQQGGLTAEGFGVQALGLGAFVFVFGFLLLYALWLF
jgi:hypothetical protein